MMHRGKQGGGYDTVMHRLFRMQEDYCKIKLYLEIKKKKKQFRNIFNIFSHQINLTRKFIIKKKSQHIEYEMSLK